MTPDDIDALLADAGATYNAPPEPPREAMWEAIARARADARVVPIRPVRRLAQWGRTAAGIAAVLLVGILIGRQTRNTAAPLEAGRSAIVAPARPSTDVASTDVANTDVARVAPNGVQEPVGGAAGAQRSEDSRVPSARRELRQLATRLRSRRAPYDLTGDDAAYRLAVIQHLTRSEVVLTSFRSQARSLSDANMDAQFASLTRDLLGTTRLMIATHRNDDPTMTRLLEDLELVLMQISQYAAQGRRTDLDAATQSIDRRNVIPKLRSTIPAGT